MNTPIRPPHVQQEINQRIFRAWLRVPELRLGQLLSNATHFENDGDNFFTEDESLATLVEKYAAEHESPNAHVTGPERQPARLEPAVETPEELIELTEKELVAKYLDSELGMRLKLIYDEYLLGFITPSMFEAIQHAVSWIPDTNIGKRGIRSVDSVHHVPDREIESIVRCLIASEGGL